MKNILIQRLAPAMLFLLFFTPHTFAVNPTYADTIIKTQFHSAILNQNRELIIYFPRNYDSTKRYPVMYVLDGSSQGNHISSTFDSLFVADHIPQVIIVAIPNMSAPNRIFQLVPPFMRTDPDSVNSPAGTGDIFLSFMETELIPFIQKKYPVSDTRLFAGNSRGGLLVLYSLLYKPDLFQARFCFSTPVWRENNLFVSRMDDFLTSKSNTRTFLYMSVGASETENMKSGLDAMIRTLRQKTSAGFTWHTDYTPGATHQNNAQSSAATGIRKWSEYVKNPNR
jgi:predicted alpha/beta superfamily hydrolase